MCFCQAYSKFILSSHHPAPSLSRLENSALAPRLFHGGSRALNLDEKVLDVPPADTDLLGIDSGYGKHVLAAGVLKVQRYVKVSS